MTKRKWCPECRTGRHPYQLDDDGTRCGECGSEVVEKWPLYARVGQRAAQAIGLMILAMILLGPPVWAVMKLLSDAPLYATRTVTVTEPYGVLVSVPPVLLVWALFIVMSWGMITGAFPAPRIQ